MFDKEKTCAFTGHRPQKLNIDEKRAKQLLTIAIRNAINAGYNTFISGMAMGIDIWAAEVVLDLKKENPSIHLVCALPYSTFYRGRSRLESEKYHSILSQADVTHISFPFYDPRSYQSRNIWMVDNSNLIIAFFSGEFGGTKNTIDYAKKEGIEIINLLN